MTITFVCVGNTCRSPLLKGLFESYARAEGFDCVVKSAGLCVSDGKISAYTEKMLLEYGIHVENQNTTILDKTLVDDSDLIIAVTDKIAKIIEEFGSPEKVFSLANPLLIGQEMSDPYGMGDDAYRRTFKQALFALPKILALARIFK